MPIPEPTNLVRQVTVQHRGTGPARNVIYEGLAAREPTNTTIAHHRQTIATIIAEDPNWWMYKHSAFPNDGREIADAMRAGTLLVVTDGSYMAELSTRHASAAWVAKCPTTGIQCHGILPVPGTEQEVNPYRAELTSLLAVRKALEMIAQRWEVTQATVTL